MPSHRFGLLFRSREGGASPGGSISHIYVRGRSEHSYENIRKGLQFITAQCGSYDELEHEVEALKRELDSIKKGAKKRYAAAGWSRGS